MSLRIIPRSEWGAKHGRGGDATSKLPWGEAVIHTEAGAVRTGDWPEITAAAAVMSLTEQQHVQAVERYHAVTLGWNGIGYSFFITRDGSIFEGRGWGRQGSHTETRNSTAVGICFAGHGDVQPATEAQWLAAEWLIREGIRLGHLTAAPKITGHRQYSTKGKTCPGGLIFPLLGRLRNLTAAPKPPPAPPTPAPDEELTMAQAEELAKKIEELAGRQKILTQWIIDQQKADQQKFGIVVAYLGLRFGATDADIEELRAQLEALQPAPPAVA